MRWEKIRKVEIMGGFSLKFKIMEGQGTHNEECRTVCSSACVVVGACCGMVGGSDPSWRLLSSSGVKLSVQFHQYSKKIKLFH